jgi:hypothetical protein
LGAWELGNRPPHSPFSRGPSRQCDGWFLPSLKGANPYKQAYERGVTLIGATADHVTADFGEGPIIEQDIARITHAQSAEDYVSIGRDVADIAKYGTRQCARIR